MSELLDLLSEWPGAEAILDAVPDGWAKVHGRWVPVAEVQNYEVHGPSGVILGCDVLITATPLPLPSGARMSHD